MIFLLHLIFRKCPLMPWGEFDPDVFLLNTNFRCLTFSILWLQSQLCLLLPEWVYFFFTEMPTNTPRMGVALINMQFYSYNITMYVGIFNLPYWSWCVLYLDLKLNFWEVVWHTYKHWNTLYKLKCCCMTTCIISTYYVSVHIMFLMFMSCPKWSIG